MDYQLQQDGKFEYIDEGEGEVLLLLHGLFGALSNYHAIIEAFKTTHRVVVPVLPIFDMPKREISVTSLAKHVNDFLTHKKISRVHALGNSLGGHVGLVLSLEAPAKLRTLTLTGSSGLFERGLGKSYPRRQDYNYIRENTEATFYDPSVASKELVDNVFEIVNNPETGLRVVIAAKSAMKHNLEDVLHQITPPTLLIWGKQDTITPPFVAEEFHKGIPNTELHFIDKCGHAPMMEQPAAFVEILGAFLRKHAGTA